MDIECRHKLVDSDYIDFWKGNCGKDVKMLVMSNKIFGASCNITVYEFVVVRISYLINQKLDEPMMFRSGR